MITAKYIQDDALQSEGTLTPNNSIVVSYNDLRIGKPAMNYITMDALGMDLYDDNSEFITENDYCGYISQSVSDSNGIITDTIKVTGSNMYIKHGITFCFVTQYPTNVTLTAYSAINNGEIIFEGTFEITSLYHHIDLEPLECASLIITFNNTQLPHSFIKLESLVLGGLHIFNDFADFDYIDEVNVLSADLPIGEISFSVFSDTDLLGVEGNKLYFFDGSHFMGEYYLVTSDRETETKYNFVVQNQMFKADKTKFEDYAQALLSTYLSEGSFAFAYQRPINYQRGSGEMASIIPGALETCLDKCGVRYEIDNYFLTNNDLWLTPYLKPGSCRYALTQLCWVLGAYIICSDKVYIKPLSAISTQTPKVITNEDNRIIRTSVSKAKKISNVLWDLPMYSRDDSPQIKKVSSVNVATGSKITIAFNNPTKVMSVVYSSGAEEENIYETPYTISFFNGTKESGEITINGFDLNNSKITEIIPINSDGDEEKYSKYDLMLLDSAWDPLIDFKKSQLEKAARENKVLKATIGYSGEKTGDLISIQTNLGDMFTGIITKIGFSSPNTHRTAEIEVQQWNI